MRIKLSKKVLKHIATRHPEVKAYTNKIAETVQNPDLVVRGLKGELKALKFCPALHLGSKYLVVIYRDVLDEKIIMTAYFTSNIARVKGEVIWRKSQ